MNAVNVVIVKLTLSAPLIGEKGAGGRERWEGEVGGGQYMFTDFTICLVSMLASSIQPAQYKAVLDELPPLISDMDLHISQLVLLLLCTIVDISPKSITQVFCVC